MPFRRDSRPAPDQIEAIIGPRATFDGRLRCDGSVRVDGTVYELEEALRGWKSAASN